MQIYNRKPNRLKEYDYSETGGYFVTICVKNRGKGHFGKINEDKMILNKYGVIVDNCWKDLPKHYPNCILDEFIIMPNHLHGMIIINNDNVGAGFKPAQGDVNAWQKQRNGYKPFPTKIYSLSEIIRGFKTFSSKKINKTQNNFRFEWQKSFFDHIIRNEKSLINIREYIINNPLKWHLDRNNPNNINNI